MMLTVGLASSSRPMGKNGYPIIGGACWTESCPLHFANSLNIDRGRPWLGCGKDVSAYLFIGQVLVGTMASQSVARSAIDFERKTLAVESMFPHNCSSTVLSG